MISSEDSHIKKVEYEYLLNLTYKKAVTYLLNKYGEVSDDFFKEKSYVKFLNGEIKAITKGNYSKTSAGLFCHHIDENKFENISNLEYIKHYKYPFIYQKKERLVYCDLFEHLILHALIIKETGAEYGVSGYDNYLYPMVTDWIIKRIDPKPDWMKKCKKRALLSQIDAKNLLSIIDNSIKTVNEARFAILHEEHKIRLKQTNAAKLGLTISEYEQYLLRKELKVKEKLKLEELEKVKYFNKKYPNLQTVDVNIKTPRKKILNLLYDHLYNKKFSNRKDFYKTKITILRDDLLNELNDTIN